MASQPEFINLVEYCARVFSIKTGQLMVYTTATEILKVIILLFKLVVKYYFYFTWLFLKIWVMHLLVTTHTYANQSNCLKICLVVIRFYNKLKNVENQIRMCMRNLFINFLTSQPDCAAWWNWLTELYFRYRVYSIYLYYIGSRERGEGDMTSKDAARLTFFCWKKITLM